LGPSGINQELFLNLDGLHFWSDLLVVGPEQLNTLVFELAGILTVAEHRFLDFAFPVVTENIRDVRQREITMSLHLPSIVLL